MQKVYRKEFPRGFIFFFKWVFHTTQPMQVNAELVTGSGRKDYSMSLSTCYKKVLVGLKYDPVKRNITEAAIEVHQRDEQHTFTVMPRKKFAVNPMGYFQAVES